MSCFENLANHLQTLRNCFSKQTDESCSDDQQTRSSGIPLSRKVCYAVGGVPYQMTTAAIRISLQIFLLDVVQMEASYVSVILFVSRAWDAVTDPVVGFLVSRSSWTPIGKLTPWLLISSPFCVVSYVMLWFVPGCSTPDAASVLWFLVAACLFETLMSCYNVPYVSLNMFLGGRQRDRDSAIAYRMSVEMLAMLLASVIQGQVVSVYNTEKEEACEHQVHQTPQSTSAPLPASLQETQKAFLTSALVMAALFFLCSLVVFFGVREQQVPPSSEEKTRPSYLTSLKMLVCHVPYQRLVLGFVFSVLAFQMSLGNFALFCSHAAGLGAQFQLLLLVLLVSASVAVPFWQMVLLKIGKKATLFTGLLLFIPAVIVVACDPSNFPVFMSMCILMGFSVATMFLLPWSMLPDVVDDFAVKHPSCKDLEPLFFSGYAFCSKLAGGLSAGLSTMTLQVVGYKASACEHGDGVVTALIVLFSPVPITLLLTGMVFFFTYPINERQRLELQDQQLHPEATSSSSSPDPRDHTEQQIILQKSGVGTTSASHPNPKTNTLHKPGFSPCCYENGSIKLSTCSNVSNDLFGKSRRSKSHVQWHKEILGPKRHKGDEELVGKVPGNNTDAFSSRSYVQSKVTWV